MDYKKVCRLLMNCKKAKRVPTVNTLLKRLCNGEVFIIYRSSDDIDSGITIFSDGSVVYGNGIKTTVFAIVTFWYRKGAFDRYTGELSEDYIKDPDHDEIGTCGIPNWLYDLILFGEKRINQYESTRIERYEKPVDDVDLYQELHFEEDDAYDVSEDIINKVYVAELLSCLNKKQRFVIRLRYWDGLTFEQIADVLNSLYLIEGKNKHATRQSVCQMVNRALALMRRKTSE